MVPAFNETISVQAAKKRDKASSDGKESDEPYHAGMKRVVSSLSEAKTGRKTKEIETTEKWAFLSKDKLRSTKSVAEKSSDTPWKQETVPTLQSRATIKKP